MNARHHRSVRKLVAVVVLVLSVFVPRAYGQIRQQSLWLGDASSNWLRLTFETGGSDWTLKFPSTAGSNGQVLKTDGSGNMTWTSPLVNPMTTIGDLIIGGSGGAATRLAQGGNGTVLTSNGSGGFTWSTPLVNPMTTLGDILYENGTPAAARLAGNTTTTTMFLSQTGDGSNSAAPAWSALGAGDIPSLDASKITTGTFGTSQIPSLDAAKITTGTLDANRIPDLSSSYIKNSSTQQTSANFNVDGNGTVGGKVVIGANVSGTNDLNFGGAADRTEWMERNTTDNAAGHSLTVQAGAPKATNGTSNEAGGNLVLSSGISEGTATSSILFKAPTAGSSGNSDNTPSTVATLNATGFSLGSGATRTMNVAAPTSNGNGNRLNIAAGAGYASDATNENGGDVYLDGGAKANSGTNGNVYIGATNNPSNVNIGNAGGTTTFTGNVSFPSGSISAGGIGLTYKSLMVGNSSGYGSALATANNGVLVTDGAGIPSISSTLPAVSGANITSLNAGNISSGTLAVNRGGTGLGSYTTGDLLYASNSSTLAPISVGAHANGEVLTLVGGVPAWSAGGGTSFANPSTTIGLSANNGSATSAMRSDATPALSQAIVPTWTGTHTFSKTATPTSYVNGIVLSNPTASDGTNTIEQAPSIEFDAHATGSNTAVYGRETFVPTTTPAGTMNWDMSMDGGTTWINYAKLTGNTTSDLEVGNHGSSNKKKGQIYLGDGSTTNTGVLVPPASYGGNRTWTMPDASGTVALVGSVSSNLSTSYDSLYIGTGANAPNTNLDVNGDIAWRKKDITVDAGSDVNNIDASGTSNIRFTVSGTATITAASESTNDVTITVGNSFSAGDTVTIAGVTPSGYNGTWVVTSATTTAFHYTNPTSGLGAGSVFGTVSHGNSLSIGGFTSTSGKDGKRLRLYYPAGYSLTLKNGNGSASEPIKTLAGGDVTLSPTGAEGSVAELVYSSTSGNWILQNTLTKSTTGTVQQGTQYAIVTANEASSVTATNDPYLSFKVTAGATYQVHGLIILSDSTATNDAFSSGFNPSSGSLTTCAVTLLDFKPATGNTNITGNNAITAGGSGNLVSCSSNQKSLNRIYEMVDGIFIPSASGTVNFMWQWSVAQAGSNILPSTYLSVTRVN